MALLLLSNADVDGKERVSMLAASLKRASDMDDATAADFLKYDKYVNSASVFRIKEGIKSSTENNSHFLKSRQPAKLNRIMEHP